MRVTIVKLLLLVLVLAAGYVALFQREWAMSWFRKGVQKAKGYGLAETPNQAAEQFCKATKERDYDTAQDLYCDTDYSEQMRKASKEAKNLGQHVDKLLAKMDSAEIKSDKAKAVLKLLDPFPTTIEIQDVKQKGDDEAVGVLKDIKPIDEQSVLSITWKFNPPLVFRALYAPSPLQVAAKEIPVKLKRVEKDGKHFWKVDYPVTPYMREQVNRLVDKSSELCKGLRKLTEELNNEATTKADFETRFKEVLQTAVK
jgi:hypothetical protein